MPEHDHTFCAVFFERELCTILLTLSCSSCGPMLMEEIGFKEPFKDLWKMVSQLMLYEEGLTRIINHLCGGCITCRDAMWRVQKIQERLEPWVESLLTKR